MPTLSRLCRIPWIPFQKLSLTLAFKSGLQPSKGKIAYYMRLLYMTYNHIASHLKEIFYKCMRYIYCNLIALLFTILLSNFIEYLAFKHSERGFFINTINRYTVYFPEVWIRLVYTEFIIFICCPFFYDLPIYNKHL